MRAAPTQRGSNSRFHLPQFTWRSSNTKPSRRFVSNS